MKTIRIDKMDAQNHPTANTLSKLLVWYVSRGWKLLAVEEHPFPPIGKVYKLGKA